KVKKKSAIHSEPEAIPVKKARSEPEARPMKKGTQRAGQASADCLWRVEGKQKSLRLAVGRRKGR
ncbi:MAG TPA: hypothetical protein H9840_04160, partial [Candidatus Anaerofilum excrementigallinarum]|nr:hypothetical protein [Candidatus Anaerofilum excrementigallinarum]